MLTPSGLGKEFRVTGKAYRPSKRRNRGRRRVMAVLVVVVVLGAGGWSAYRYGPFGGASASAAACARPTATALAARPQPVAAIQPGQVVLKVLNATNRQGLARQTATLLGQRGFVNIGTGNDPEPVPGPAIVRSGPAGQQAQALVLAQVDGAQPATDNRPDASVDLILGNGFVALRDPAAVAAALTPTPTPTPTPTKAACH